MDHEMIKTHLEQAERHVADGAKRVQRQREIHSELVRDGHIEAATKAVAILRQLRECQEVFIADRDRLISELAKDSE